MHVYFSHFNHLHNMHTSLLQREMKCKSSGNLSDAAGNILSEHNEFDFCPESSSALRLTEVIAAYFVCLCCWLCHFPAE